MKRKTTATETPKESTVTSKTKYGKVKVAAKRSKWEMSTLCSTNENLNPTKNKIRVRKDRDEKYRQAMADEEKKERDKRQSLRRKLMPILDLTQIEQKWDKYVREIPALAEIPVNLISPALNAHERKNYDEGDIPVHFYVTKIEQVNTNVPRGGKSKTGRRNAARRKRRYTKTNDDTGFVEDCGFQEDNLPKKRKKRRRKKSDDSSSSSEDDDDSDEPGRVIATVKKIGKKRQKPGHGKTVLETAGETKKVYTYTGFTVPDAPTGNKEKGKRKLVHDAVPSSRPWFNLNQDKTTIEATLRLRGVMEQWVDIPATESAPARRELQTVDGVVYIHNFRPYLYLSVPTEMYKRWGLEPRFDGERGIHSQFMDATVDGHVSPHDDAKQTGILDANSRKTIREFLGTFSAQLEKDIQLHIDDLKKKQHVPTPRILRTRLVWKASQQGFQNNCLYPFLEVRTCLPDVVPMVRDRFLKDKESCYVPFECDVLYLARYMQDTQNAGETWITLPPRSYSIRPMPDRETLGMRLDPVTGEYLPAVAEFDTSVHTIQVHNTRDQISQTRRNAPFNAAQLRDRCKGISWFRKWGYDVDPTYNGEGLVIAPQITQPPGGPMVMSDEDSARLAAGNARLSHHVPTPDSVMSLTLGDARSSSSSSSSISSSSSSLSSTTTSTPNDERIVNKEFLNAPGPIGERDWKRIPAYRLVAYDIECRSLTGSFPDAQLDPEIARAYVFDRMVRSGPLKTTKESHAVIICSRPSSKFEDLPNATIICVRDERELHIASAYLLYMTNPLIILSYNGGRFDFPYDLDRAQRLGVDMAQYLSIFPEPMTVSEVSKGTQGGGDKIHVQIDVPGVNVLDEMIVIKQIEMGKLTSYTLNNVSYTYLEQAKDDIHHTDIPQLYDGPPDRVRKLLHYNFKDSWLVLRLFYERKHNLNIPMLSRITGIQAQQLFDWGPSRQSNVTMSIECAVQGILKPYRVYKLDKSKFTGATVIEPITGFIPDPMLTFDFASLYPSIIIAFNLCSTTFLTKEQIIEMGLPPHLYIAVPSGRGGKMTYWARPALRRGILPVQLLALGLARAAAKDKMSKAKDDIERDVYDAIQGGVKIKSNSAYGITKQILEEIASTVTYFGRLFIKSCKDLVETKYVPENGFGPAEGYPQEPKVRYGDTDSIMCHFGPITLPRSFVLGKLVGIDCNKIFEHINLENDLLDPVRENRTTAVGRVFLEFEKVYYPFMIPKKKRYGGPNWTPKVYELTGSYTKMDKKGSEAVRSDACKMMKKAMQDVYDMLLLGHLSPPKKDMLGTGRDLLRELFEEERQLHTYGLSRHPKRHVPIAEHAAHPEIIDFTTPEFVDPYKYWSDPKSADFTAPLPLPLKIEKGKSYPQETIEANQAQIQPITRQVLLTRVRIACFLICCRARLLLQGKVDISDLVLSKSLRKKNYATLVIPLAVANNIRARDPGSAPRTGDRVQYVLRCMPKGSAIALCADAPQHVLKNRDPIDFKMYEQKQLRQPLASMMIPVFKTLYPEMIEFQHSIYYNSDPDDDDEGVEGAHMNADDVVREFQDEAMRQQIQMACPAHFPSSLVDWFKNPTMPCFLWGPNVKDRLSRSWVESLGLYCRRDESAEMGNVFFDDDRRLQATLAREGHATFFSRPRLIVCLEDPLATLKIPERKEGEPIPFSSIRLRTKLVQEDTDEDDMDPVWIHLPCDSVQLYVEWVLYDNFVSPFLLDRIKLLAHIKYRAKSFEPIALVAQVPDQAELADGKDVQIIHKLTSVQFLEESGKRWSQLYFAYHKSPSILSNPIRAQFHIEKVDRLMANSKKRKDRLVKHSDSKFSGYQQSIDRYLPKKSNSISSTTKPTGKQLQWVPRTKKKATNSLSTIAPSKPKSLLSSMASSFPSSQESSLSQSSSSSSSQLMSQSSSPSQSSSFGSPTTPLGTDRVSPGDSLLTLSLATMSLGDTIESKAIHGDLLSDVMTSMTLGDPSEFRSHPKSAMPETKTESKIVIEPKAAAKKADALDGNGRYKINIFSTQDLKHKTSQLQPTPDEIKYIRRIMNARTKKAIASSGRLIFAGLDKTRTKVASIFHSPLFKMMESLEGEGQVKSIRRSTCISCKTVITRANSHTGEQDDVMCQSCSCTCNRSAEACDDEEEKFQKHLVQRRMTRMRKDVYRRPIKSSGSGSDGDDESNEDESEEEEEEEVEEKVEETWAKKCGCRRDVMQNYQQRTVTDIERAHEDIWKGCIKCADSREDAERCKNFDCQFFFRRQTLAMDLETERNKLKKFDPIVSIRYET